MIDLKTIKLLEFDKVLSLVADNAISVRAKKRILEEKPSFNYDDVIYMQSLTNEAEIISNKYLLNPISSFDEIDEILHKARADAMLQMGELLKVARVIKSARILKSTILSTGDDIVQLRNMVTSLYVDTTLENDINTSIISEYEMSDNASDKLRVIRRKLLALNIKLKDKLASYTKSNEASQYLQDNIVTIREGRYVLPVRSDSKSQVKGLIHDRSASGNTLFIEPFVIVELNNELRELSLQEQAEIERILIEFSKRVQDRYENLFQCQEISTMTDIVFAKYRYSVKINARKPEIIKNINVELSQARHPLIDTEKVVPISVAVGNNYKILLITGPNTGGKTVCLKTVGLFCLMAYTGLFLPAQSSKICVFDNIFCDIGDEQSISESLSTFSSHMVNIINITNNVTNNSLVLLDELGGGTDPLEGAALAQGIIKYFEIVQNTAIITTHYSELKEYALISPNVKNGSMQFDEQTLSPTYKLVMGVPGTSNALKIAKRLGINDFIIKSSYACLDDEKIQFERILQNAEQIKKEAMLELEQASKMRDEIANERLLMQKEKEKIQQAYDKIKDNAKAETRRIVANSVEVADDLIDKIKTELKKLDETSLMNARRYKNELDDLKYNTDKELFYESYSPIKPQDIKIGKEVIVINLGSTATIAGELTKKNEVLVQIGYMKTKVKLENLGLPIKKPEEIAKKQIKKQNYTPPKPLQDAVTFEEEVKVLGKTVSEAIQIIEPFIISLNANDGNKILRIVHGKGTGALGKGIQSYLKTNPMVAKFRYGRYGEGDNGVTIAEIK